MKNCCENNSKKSCCETKKVESSCKCGDGCNCGCKSDCGCESDCSCDDDCDDDHERKHNSKNVKNDCGCESDCDTKNDCDSKSNVDKTKSLKKQIEISNKKINELSLEIINLKQQIISSQDVYKSKLEEKTREANQKLSSIKEELKKHSLSEIEIKKHQFVSNDMQQLFNTIDQFENIVNAPSDNPQISAYVSGFKMLLSLFEQSLNEMGITRVFVKVGDKFDDEIMTAIDVVENKEHKKGVVIKVQSPAYFYNNKIVKHAIVIVSK